MFDEARYIIIMTEGIHDLMTVGCFLKHMGFKEIKSTRDLPKDIEMLVPKKYPFDNNDMLSWVVPCPTFYCSNNVYIVIKQGGGSNIIRNFCDVVERIKVSAYKTIYGIAFILDADKKTPEEKIGELRRELCKAFEGLNVATSMTSDKCITIAGIDIPSQYYVLPDNNRLGTVECMLLHGAETSNPELIIAANSYMEDIPQEYKEDWKPFDHLKVKVGAISNIFRPGKANQVSIHDGYWITSDTIEKSEDMQKLKVFLEQVISPTMTVEA